MLRGISRYLASGIPYGYQRGSVVPRVCARAFTTESPFKEPKKNTQDTAPEEDTTNKSQPTDHIPGMKNIFDRFRGFGKPTGTTSPDPTSIQVLTEIVEIYKAMGGTYEKIGEIYKETGNLKDRAGQFDEEVEKIHKETGNLKDRVGQFDQKIGEIHKEIGNLKDRAVQFDGRLRFIQWQLGTLLGVLSLFLVFTGFMIKKAVDIPTPQWIEKDSPAKKKSG